MWLLVKVKEKLTVPKHGFEVANIYIRIRIKLFGSKP